MKITFARHQHDTERTPEQGCSRRQLFRHYCGSSGQRVNRKNRSFAKKIPARSILSPNIELQQPPNHAISRVCGKARVQVPINQSIISLFQFGFYSTFLLVSPCRVDVSQRKCIGWPKPTLETRTKPCKMNSISDL